MTCFCLEVSRPLVKVLKPRILYLLVTFLLLYTMSFSAIPILDLSRARDPETKPGFLADLRHALLEVGFLYIERTGIDERLTEDVVANCHAFFDLPDEPKLDIEMKNAKSFLGASAHVNAHPKLRS